MIRCLLSIAVSLLFTYTLCAQQEGDNISITLGDDDVNDSIQVKEMLKVADSQPEGSALKIEYLLRALQIAEKYNRKEDIGLCYYHIAWHYVFKSNQAKAIESFKNVISNSTDPKLLVNSYGVVANICSWNGAPEKAKKWANDAVEVAEKSESPREKANAYIFMGDAYRYDKDRTKANYYYFKALAFLKQDTKPGGAMLGVVYLHTLDNEKITLDFPFYLLQWSMKLGADYDASPNIDKQVYILSLMKVATAYKDSAKNELVKQIELESKETQTRLYIIGISILVLMTGLLLWQSRSRQKMNKKLAVANKELELTNQKLAETNNELKEANDIKSRFFGILNHDLRRPVSSLIHYLELKNKVPEIFTPGQEELFEQKILDMTQELLENMEGLLFWSKSQMQNFTPVFQEVMVSRLFDETKSFFNIEKNVEFSYKLLSDFSISTDINYLKTIMRNLTSNAISAVKEVDNAYIEWNAYKEDDQLILSVTNNGPEMVQEKIDILYNKSLGKENIKDGLGLIIIRDLAASINCKIRIITNNTIGTTFLLIFKR